MFVDHMHQPWRILAAIINKCLSGKTASNDKLRKSRIDILWGMFYRENVDYPELIWEDLDYQSDHRKDKRSRRENMPFPRFTKVTINHFLKQHKSFSNLKYQHYHTIKDDAIVCRLKFVRIGEDYQEYGLAILEVMLNDAIKQSESYQMFIKYSTGQIPPKKSRGKGKSISKTEAEEPEAARQVHATHARIVTESVPEPTRRRKSGKVTSNPPKKLKGVPSLTPEEQEAADIMQALKESKKDKQETASEGTGTKPGVPDEEKDITKEHVILDSSKEDKLDDEEKDDKERDAKDEGDDHISDIQYTNDEDDEIESDEDDIYKYKIPKAGAEKTSEVKDDAKKTELPPTSSSLYVSSRFGDQFIKLSSDSSLVSTVKDTIDAEIN
ncbi:hypothetical protein Tco_0781513 [Tanacetum coccineum]